MKGFLDFFAGSIGPDVPFGWTMWARLVERKVEFASLLPRIWGC